MLLYLARLSEQFRNIRNICPVNEIRSEIIIPDKRYRKHPTKLLLFFPQRSISSSISLCPRFPQSFLFFPDSAVLAENCVDNTVASWTARI